MSFKTHRMKNEFENLNKKMAECFGIISSQIPEINDYIEIKKSFEETEDNLEHLQQLAKYVNFTLESDKN